MKGMFVLVGFEQDDTWPHPRFAQVQAVSVVKTLYLHVYTKSYNECKISLYALNQTCNLIIRRLCLQEPVNNLISLTCEPIQMSSNISICKV